ncbi:helix-turn-helix domain-containing protein [Curtobacterium aurantiacum]|uniref:helix-turn-helix domain-containing protein n=1 Tax=Curtobacterium aurantiacum TaxID=3236919 RepID=UPI001BDFE346|nr:excisionase family DNA-binding protein [Curtobacterium flaccumfaciens pv. flaccumfaciens]
MGEVALTAAELAAALQVSIKTIYQYARDGTIPSVRVGRSWRFWLEDVKRALETPTVDLWAAPSRKKVRR